MSSEVIEHVVFSVFLLLTIIILFLLLYAKKCREIETETPNGIVLWTSYFKLSTWVVTHKKNEAQTVSLLNQILLSIIGQRKWKATIIPRIPPIHS